MSTSATSLDTLIIVCCHAIYFGAPYDPRLESSWFIEPFQSGEVPTFISHIDAGVNQLRLHGERALLCFSGGRTKQDRTGRSEAQGYLETAEEIGLLSDFNSNMQARVLCDEWATDSFQNILCSLVQWPVRVQKLQNYPLNAETGARGNVDANVAWPKKLVIVSHEFKRLRFEELHLPALRWNGVVEFIGIDPMFNEKKMAEIVEGDRVRGYGAWKRDLYGHGQVLAAKREKRGWNQDAFIRDVLRSGFSEDDKDRIAKLITWNGGKDALTRFPDAMPWEQQSP